MALKGDEDGCGCVVKSVMKGGAVGLDGRIGVGDHIVAVNDESMIGLSGHRARYWSLKRLTRYRVCTQSFCNSVESILSWGHHGASERTAPSTSSENLTWRCNHFVIIRNRLGVESVHLFQK